MVTDRSSGSGLELMSVLFRHTLLIRTAFIMEQRTVSHMIALALTQILFQPLLNDAGGD